MIVVRKCTILVLTVQVHCTIVLNDRPCCTGICTCEGWLTGGKPGRKKCRGCNHGADMWAVDACLNAAQQWDHTSQHLREDVVERGGWASDWCTCDGACSIVDTILGQGQRLTMKPCRLSEYPRLHCKDAKWKNPKNKGRTIFARHMCCVARSLCCDCHLNFTAYRASKEIVVPV